MAPWAWRIGCKPEGRSEVVVMAGGCAGAYLSMVRCSLCAPCDVEPAFRGAAHEADKRPARHRVSDEGGSRPCSSLGLRHRSLADLSGPSAPSPSRRWVPRSPGANTLREAQKEPQAQPAGIVATTSRSAGGCDPTIGARSRRAGWIRPCGGHASRLRPPPCLVSKEAPCSKTSAEEVLLFAVSSLPKVPNWTPMARRPAPAAVRGHGERVTRLGAISHSPSGGRG